MNARRSLAAAALVLVTPALSACAGVNFGAQTEQVYNPAEGVNNRSGAVDVLDALVVSGGSGSGTVVATLVNNDLHRADSLQAVAGTGPDASLQVTPGGSTSIPADGVLSLADKGRVFVRGQAIKPGYFVHLRFSFAHAQAADLEVPVVPANVPEYSNIPLPSGS